MTDQHTPGPWIIDGQLIYALDETGRVNRFTASVQGGWITRRGERVSETELNANARLIAAAPDLLAALRAAMHVLEYTQVTDSAVARYEQARAAIAKATEPTT